MVLPNLQSDVTRPDSGEEVLQAFNEWLAKDRLLGRNPNNSQPLPSEGQTYIPLQTRRSQKIDKPDSDTKSRPSVTRRVLRTFAFGLVAVVIALAGIIWRSERSEPRAKAWSLQGSLDTPAPAPLPSVTTASNQPSLDSPSNIKKQIAAPSPVIPVHQQIDEEYATIQREIEVLTTKVDVVRKIAEQLAINQLKMEQTIAAIKNVQKNLDQRLPSATSRSAVAHPIPRKPTSDPQPRKRPVSTSQSVEPPLPLH
jgi:hypothetical protein